MKTAFRTQANASNERSKKIMQVDFAKNSLRRIACAALCALAVVTLAGCASDYSKYAGTALAQTQATEATKGKRFEALGALGCTTSELVHEGKVVRRETKCDPEAAKFAAFALAVSGMTQAPEPQAKIAAPYTFGQAIHDVGQLLVPLANAGVQLYGVRRNADVSIAQSNNSAAVAISTNNTMAGIATGGFNAAAGIAGNGLAAATTLGNRPTTVVNGNGNAVNGGAAASSFAVIRAS